MSTELKESIFGNMEISEIDSEKIKREIDTANDLVWNQRNSPSSEYDPIALMDKALEQSKALNYAYGEARCLLNAGMGAFIVSNDHANAFKLFESALSLFEEIKDEKWTANTYITRAIIRNSIGSPETALYDGLKGIGFYEQRPYDPDLTMAFYVMGTVYKDLKRYDEAEKYYRRGIADKEKLDAWTGRIYTSLSNILAEQGKYPDALELAVKSLDILQQANNLIGQSRALNDIGCIYKKIGENEKALDHLFKALDIRKKNNLKHFILPSLIDIAEVYVQKNDLDSAMTYFLEAEGYGIETNHFARLTSVYRSLANIYKNKKDFQKLVETYEKLLDMNTRAHLLERETKLNQSESKLVKEKEEEIERLKNFELKKAYEVIEQKNKDIHDSITYAKRIQYALLAHDEFLNANMPDHFLYFKPKDIVSGDFYWATSSGNKFYLAVCDSTGHGVPGAFMSLLNIGFLSEAINEKEILKPNEVLDFVRRRLIDNISKEGQQDGFDGILICMEPTSTGMNITYAAANNVPVIVKNGTITELQADHMPVGMGETLEPFKLFTVETMKGDVLYLYTDGYADQFGGPRGKKFKYKQLNDLLLEISKKPMEEQRSILDKTFEDWMGDLEQVDDVLLVGIRI